jgi:hypothetical protein
MMHANGRLLDDESDEEVEPQLVRAMNRAATLRSRTRPKRPRMKITIPKSGVLVGVIEPSGHAKERSTRPAVARACYSEERMLDA